MTSQNSTPPTSASPLLTERDLAARWSVAAGSLANARSRGASPVPFIKVLGRVRYRLADIEAYEAERTHHPAA